MGQCFKYLRSFFFEPLFAGVVDMEWIDFALKRGVSFATYWNDMNRIQSCFQWNLFCQWTYYLNYCISVMCYLFSVQVHFWSTRKIFRWNWRRFFQNLCPKEKINRLFLPMNVLSYILNLGHVVLEGSLQVVHQSTKTKFCYLIAIELFFQVFAFTRNFEIAFWK